jgi:hypothetical protein
MHARHEAHISNTIANILLVERCCALGLGHRRRQLRHLPQPHHGPVHRLPGQPSHHHKRGVHCRVGHLQREFLPIVCILEIMYYRERTARLPLPLHLPLAQDPPSMPAGQPRLGVPEVRPLRSLGNLWDREELRYQLEVRTCSVYGTSYEHGWRSRLTPYNGNDTRGILYDRKMVSRTIGVSLARKKRKE